MRPQHNLAGRRFGRLTVKDSFVVKNQKRHWLCVCDCGTEKYIVAHNLCPGKTGSCGCAIREATISRNTKHGLTGHPLYRHWLAMRWRCSTKYAARGISVCARWDHFPHFLEDMGSPPTAGMTIDRINNDGDYEPGNCRWATTAEQSRNTRKTVRATLHGRTQCIAEWARELGLEASSVNCRIRRGESPESALTRPFLTARRRST